MTAVINVIAFPLLAIAWLAFGVAALRDPAHPTRLWNWFRHLSLVVQGLAWLLLLPVVLALWDLARLVAAGAAPAAGGWAGVGVALRHVAGQTVGRE